MMVPEIWRRQNRGRKKKEKEKEEKKNECEQNHIASPTGIANKQFYLPVMDILAFLRSENSSKLRCGAAGS